jgi:hypothetical protein
MGDFQGPAATLGTGHKVDEAAFTVSSTQNMTLVLPYTSSLAPVGGWLQGGGHSYFSSTRGLGSDQVLSLNVVTADGRFVTADATQNQDLFFALRGGGPGRCIYFHTIPMMNLKAPEHDLSTSFRDLLTYYQVRLEL